MMSLSVFYWFDGNRNIKRQNKTNDNKMKNQWNVNRKQASYIPIITGKPRIKSKK